MRTHRISGVIMNPAGNIRLWAYLLLAAVMYFAASAGVYYLYWHIYREMMDIWGVTQANVRYAPAAIQFIYNWSGAAVVLLQNALLTGFALLLSRMTGRAQRSKQGLLRGAAAGCAVVMLTWSVLMLIGSVRLGWRLSQPAFSVDTAVIFATSVISAVGQGAFLYGSVYGELKSRLSGWLALTALAVIAAGLDVLTGGLRAMAMVNAALTAVLCCLLNAKGNGAVIGFLFARSFLPEAILGFAGSGAALYETYPVNLYWLNGGNSGPDNGLMLTIVLLGMLAAMVGRRGFAKISALRFRKKANDKSPA